MSDKRSVRLHSTAMPQRELTAEERLAVWKLIPQLRHRMFPWGARAGVVWLHHLKCLTYTGGKCGCSPIGELALAGLN
jgi:hypothetical protein